MDDPSNLAKPTSRSKFFRGAVPVAPQNPWPHDPGKCEGHGVQEVEVALGSDTNSIVYVYGPAVDPAFGHRGHPSHTESACWVQMLRLFDRFGDGHANEALGADCRSG